MKKYSDFSEEEKKLHNSEFRIRRINGGIKSDIINIAKRKGLSVNKFLLTTLHDIANSQPDFMKKPMLND